MPADHSDDDVCGPLPGADADFGFGRRKSANNAQVAVDPLVGATVGGVRLESLIAEGGMGRVYLGLQMRPERPVAVKVVKPGVLSPATLRRFERESDVLGRLQHPGITQVHACGTVAAGGLETAYFVMEYVAGARSITDYAAAHGLTDRQKLELFREACDAVIHAHARGILHRDLKPGNILISAEGGPKIIDFGVARSLDRDTILTTGCDDIGRLIGTIPYMAPEQFRGESASVDVRADVYALGVVLYELLAGRPPFDLRQAVLAHAARVVLEDEPPPVSEFHPAVDRDIGRVVGKCLEKDPERRYASVFELAADVGRFLRGEAVLARGPAPLDWLRRLWRRRPATLAFVGGTLSVVAVLAVVAALGGPRLGPAPSARRQTATWGIRGPAEDGRVAVLSADRARALQPVEGYLSVKAGAVTPEAAAILAALDCHLVVTLDELDPEAARALAEHRDGLAIGGIRKLDDDVAAALARHRGGSLNLDSVETLTAAGSRSLAGYSGWLNLNGLRAWPEGGLEAIVAHEGGLSIGLAGISPEQAEVLARHRGHLYVLGVERIDEEAARKIVAHEGAVELWRAQGITPAAAAVLRQRADIRFPGH